MRTRAERDKQYKEVQERLKSAAWNVVQLAKTFDDGFDDSMTAIAESFGIAGAEDKLKKIGRAAASESKQLALNPATQPEQSEQPAPRPSGRIRTRAEREAQFDKIHELLNNAARHLGEAARANEEMFDTATSVISDALESSGDTKKLKKGKQSKQSALKPASEPKQSKQPALSPAKADRPNQAPTLTRRTLFAQIRENPSKKEQVKGALGKQWNRQSTEAIAKAIGLQITPKRNKSDKILGSQKRAKSDTRKHGFAKTFAAENASQHLNGDKEQIKTRILKSINRDLRNAEKSKGEKLSREEKRAIAAKALKTEVVKIRQGKVEEKPKRRKGNSKPD